MSPLNGRGLWLLRGRSRAGLGGSVWRFWRLKGVGWNVSCLWVICGDEADVFWLQICMSTYAWSCTSIEPFELSTYHLLRRLHPLFFMPREKRAIEYLRPRDDDDVPTPRLSLSHYLPLRVSLTSPPFSPFLFSVRRRWSKSPHPHTPPSDNSAP